MIVSPARMQHALGNYCHPAVRDAVKEFSVQAPVTGRLMTPLLSLIGQHSIQEKGFEGWDAGSGSPVEGVGYDTSAP